MTSNRKMVFSCYAFVARITLKSTLRKWRRRSKNSRSLELLYDSRPEWFPEDSRVWPVGRWPWPTSKIPAGVSGICPKVQNRIHWRRKKKAGGGSPFSWVCLKTINRHLSRKNDRIPAGGAGERNWCCETERKYLDNTGTTRLGQISLDSSQIFTP